MPVMVCIVDSPCSEGMWVKLHKFLTSALVGGEWSASLCSCFTHGERAPDTSWIGGWVGPKAILDMAVKRKASFPAGDHTLVVQLLVN
jgi:hypothetical protein